MSAAIAAWAEQIADVSGCDPQRLASGECPFCGSEARLDVFEVWGHDFMLEGCCECMEGIAQQLLTESDTQARALMERLLGEVLLGGLRGVFDDGCGTLKLDWRLRLRTKISQDFARRFIWQHHRHLRRAPPGWKAGAAIENGHLGSLSTVAVAWLAEPTARGFPKGTTLEVRRMCVRSDLPAELVKNACTMGYGWAAREASKLGAQRLITYLRADENGASVKAAGFKPTARVRARSWNTPSRPREPGELIDKIRWEIDLTRRSRRAAHPAQTGAKLPARASLLVPAFPEPHAEDRVELFA